MFTPFLCWSICLQRLLGIQMATFRLYLVCRWSCDDFEVYKEGMAHLGGADDST
jgi:mRNA turnover protein 4